MIKPSLLIIVFFVLTVTIFAQNPKEVTENTIKVPSSSEEVFYYGFAEGDQVVFSFEEVNGKELKEFEIMAMPSSSIFLDYKTKKIENKIVNIPETGIYKFRFTNSNIVSGRICKFKIQRIPASDATSKFNPTVYTRTVYDTTYYNAPEKYLVRTDTIVSEILNQTAKVHSATNLNGNKQTISFALPTNTIAWSYYIGVDQEGQKAYENAAKQLSNSSSLISQFATISPLASLALGLAPQLPQLKVGEDVDYYLVTGINSSLFLAGKDYTFYRNGKVINDFSKMEPIPGNLSFCFFNDNLMDGVTVMVKATAIQVNPIWDTRQVRKMNITSREEMYLKN